LIAADTNVLVRLLVNDEPRQAAKARDLFEELAGQDDQAWIADTVLVEVVWTLSRAYERSRADLVAALTAMATHGTLVLESPAAVAEAIEAFEKGPADFADCLLCAKARAAGCSAVATFDRGMKALPGVRLL
jgi:predicted nucleic-acid-binding protein